jgi:hypothetical protein
MSDGLATWLAAMGTIATAGVSVYLLRRDVLDRERRTAVEERA